MEDEDFRAPSALLQAQAIANLLDTAIPIPFVGIRVGLDFLVGLIPGIGDAIMLLASLRIVQLGKQLGVPQPLRTAMLRNSVIDFGLGFIPIVGDIVDLFYKANQKNVRIMERWWIQENKARVDAAAKQKLVEWEKAQEVDPS
ncbi:MULTISPECIES: DUF4112 domain-containing protein [Alteromonadaceae]|jgi:hypothetical protein|uniref:DUF4112 domain-containing protein n=1 Tax=Brumicola blandensis TaxID=3075611 RepID=A0AAW8R2N7_9ALTE|nr:MULTISPECIES: DUF4112 domain-containing protein [unclassified Alteromonas]MDT0583527.1 DUF4112 domain-containing protein [Alteromonas sp. W409]MDT0629462.1 DUF4112 domain-containing protein [Alteromonas sp. W364]